MNKKALIKKPAQNIDTFTASQVGTLIEEFKFDIKAIAENQKALDEKFTQKFNMLFDEMGRHKESIWMLRADVTILKTDVAVLKTDVAVLKLDMTIVKTDIKEIKDMLSIHDKRLVKLEEAGSK